VLGYSPLRAGLGALPFAGAVLVISPFSPVLAARFGSRVVIPAGLALMGTGLLLAARAEVDTTYGYLALCVAVMGAGMGLVVATAGESIMTVLPTEQAGVGSAVNDTMQELGGSLGVAVIGSIVAAAYSIGVTDGGLPAALAAPASSSLQAAQATAAAAGPLGVQVQHVAAEAFTSAMTTGFTVAALVALAGAVLGAIYLPARSRPVAVPEPEALPVAA
jgi:fucose permease